MLRAFVLLLLIIVGSGPTRAVECDAANKSFIFVIELCSAAEGCQRGREKIAVTGQKAFLFNAPSQPVGLTFIIGKSVDLCSPEYTDGKECRSTDSRLQWKSTGTASLNDGLLRLEIMKRPYISGQPGQGHVSQLYAIKIYGPTCDLCHVMDVNVLFPTLPHRSARLRSTISCQVLPFAG